MAQSTSNKTRSSGTRTGKSTSAKGKSTTSKSRKKKVDNRVVNGQMRHEISGITVIVVAVALFIGAVLPQTGVVTTFVSRSLHVTFGVGAYILPVALLIIGICFLIRFSEFHRPTRISIGVSLVLVAVLVILALCTPGAESGDLSRFFLEEELVVRGGYVGAGIAWVLCELLGKVISLVLMAGVIIAAFIIIGFSFGNVVDWLRDKREERAEYREINATAYRENYRAQGGQRASTTRVVNGAAAQQQQQQLPFNQTSYGTADGQPTQVLPRKNARAQKQPSDYAAGYAIAPTVSIPGASGTPSISYPSPGYVPPAAPLPVQNVTETATSPVSASAAAPDSSKTASAQTLTRKLSRKDATKGGGTVVFDSPGTKTTTPQRLSGEAVSGAPATSSFGKDDESFKLPSLSLLTSTPASKNNSAAQSQAAMTAQLLQNTLADFHVYIDVVGWVPGPTVTLYKLAIPAGLKVQTISNLGADISRALMVDGVRIYSPVPGTPYVGIEVPNQTRQTVYLADVLKDAPDGPLQIAIGQNVDGKSIVADLAKMPHLLIGGTTGSGKSIAIHGMIVSILMRAKPSEVRFIMIDPKRVEFNHYEGIPHLYVPPVVEPKEASAALSWAVAEMELRLKKLQKAGARDIAAYNKMVEAGTVEVENAQKLPYIVIVIDELADLMMNVGKEVEFSISRIAQLARAAGIHLIVATQRPDSNIVTGLIKANITNRIALKVSSGINSSVIIDQRGAENLVGRGDMLFQTTDSPKPSRIQGCYVSDKEIDAVVAHLKKQGEPEYNSSILVANKVGIGDQKTADLGGDDADPLLWEAADLVVSNNFASTSTIQRKLSVGYARAGRIMDQLEDKGIVGPPNGSKPREVLVNVEELETIKAFDALDNQ